MPQRRVIFLDNSRLSVYRITRGAAQAEDSFALDPGGMEAFSAFLADKRRCLFMVLTDVAEEGFQLEDIPHSGGKDRTAIIKRKLAQYFYGTPFAIAQSQGRLKSGRRDERILMMALTRPQLLDPLLEVLRTHQAILVGIFSLPQVLHALLPKDSTPAQLLLITQTHGGLRQTFYADGQLRFSRLTALATGSPEESAIAAALEAGKMHQYLTSQRLIERNRPLTTQIIVHPAQAAAMRERCQETAQLHFVFADLLQEAKRTGLGSPIMDSHGELLFCHLLARKLPREQFAAPPERHHYRLWQTRAGLQGASAMILAGSILFAAQQGLESMQLRESTARIQQQVLIDQQSYDVALQALPKIPLSTDNLRALVDRYDQIAKRAQGPAPLLVQLSQSLDAFPSIAIEQLEWRVIESLAAPKASASQPATPIPPGMAQGPYAEATVTAKLPLGMAGDRRGQLALVADFTLHIGSAPDTVVTILQPPVDTQSGKTLKSGDESGTPEAPRFVFRVTHKL